MASHSFIGFLEKSYPFIITIISYQCLIQVDTRLHVPDCHFDLVCLLFGLFKTKFINSSYLELLIDLIFERFHGILGPDLLFCSGLFFFRKNIVDSSYLELLITLLLDWSTRLL